MSNSKAAGDGTNIVGVQRRLFLTGASGLLGRAIMRVFTSLEWNVYGTAFSRVGPGLHRVDLTNASEVEKALKLANPTFIIHCAAQRFPEKVQKEPEAAKILNVTATANLAKLASAMGVPMLYISSDYVFDGEKPPYKVDSVPNPINMYGRTKLAGEAATLKLGSDQPDPRNLVLRIPVLYGPVETLSESAVTVLLETLLDRSKSQVVSHHEQRRPSHVDDVAKICVRLVEERLKSADINGIFHWCGTEVFTKYEMTELMSEVFKLPFHHVFPDHYVPSTTRPYDPTLDVSRTLDLIGPFTTPTFKSNIYEVLLPWVKDVK